MTGLGVNGEALGGEFGIRARNEVFSFRRFDFVFGMDGVGGVTHPCTSENQEAVKGINFADLRDWDFEQREDDSDNG